MSKKSIVQRNIKRKEMTSSQLQKRSALKAMVLSESLTPEEKVKAMFKLSEMPRNSSPVRIRNRCELTGRPRGNYRKFKICRIKLRDLASEGMIPGMTKASW